MAISKTYELEHLLFQLEERELESLIREIELKELGWTFYYFVDPAEIRDFCFPFGLNEDEKNEILAKKSKMYISDEQNALWNFFFQNHLLYPGTMESDNGPIHSILLSEYLEETRGLIGYSTLQAKNHAIPFSNANEAFDKFFFKKDSRERKEIDRVISEDKEEQLSQFHKSYFSDFMANMLVIKDGLTKLFDILKNHIVYKEEQLEDFQFLLDAISSEQTNEAISYESIVKKIRAALRKSSYSNRASKKRDAMVIGRLIASNMFVMNNQNRPDSKKVVFLYLTDAQSSIEVLDSLRKDKSYTPITMGGQGFDAPLYRRKRQVFAQVLCYHKQRNSKEIIQKILAIKDLVKELKTDLKKFSLDEYVMFQHKDVFARYVKLRNEFENANLFRHYEDYLKEYKGWGNIFEGHQLRQIAERTIAEMDDLLGDLSVSDEEIKLISYENRFNLAYITGLDNLSTMGFNKSKGLDLIEGRYQHLPTVFWVKNNLYENILHKISSYILDRISPEDQNPLELLRSEIHKLNQQPTYELEEKLVKAYILLILPKPNVGEHISNDLIAFEWIDNIIKQQENKSGDDDPLLDEFTYLAIWAARRAGPNYYDKSFDFAEKIINNKEKSNRISPKDARFYHGRFLTRYCMLCEHIDFELKELQVSASQSDLLEKCIIDADKALKYYENNTELSIVPMDLIRQRIKSNLLNSLCYLLTCKFRVTGNADALTQARKDYLEPLKDLANIDDRYEKFPEFLHTEAFLEWQEAKIAKNSSEKLIYGRSAILRAIYTDDVEPGVKSKYEKLLSAINRDIGKRANDSN
ncbi:MAG: hypothetical protein ACKVT2_05835 [Saprospiraceae bacterium]